MWIIELMGWFGAFFLALQGVSQLIKTIKTRDFSGLSRLMILFWFLGEIFILVYIFYQEKLQWPLVFNYVLNIFICTTILGVFVYEQRRIKKNRNEKQKELRASDKIKNF